MCNTGRVNAFAAARQLLRAIRGSRSQVSFSRRLGYRSNVAADWEAGRRMPTAAAFLRAAARVAIPVDRAFEAFHPASASIVRPSDGAAIAAWLTALQGGTPVQELSDRTGLSRYAVGRILSGRTQVKVPDWLALIEALTGRCSDLVAGFVSISAVPELEAVHQNRSAARDLAFESPWTAAVLRVLETAAWRAHPNHSPELVASWLRIPLETAQEAIHRLVAVGSVEVRAGRLEAGRPLTVGTGGEFGRVAGQKAHWGRVAAERSQSPTALDQFSYNLMSLSRADRARIGELQRSYFREVRQIVAASQPEETVALLWIGLMTWDEPT